MGSALNFPGVEASNLQTGNNTVIYALTMYSHWRILCEILNYSWGIYLFPGSCLNACIFNLWIILPSKRKKGRDSLPPKSFHKHASTILKIFGNLTSLNTHLSEPISICLSKFCERIKLFFLYHHLYSVKRFHFFADSSLIFSKRISIWIEPKAELC